MNDCTSVIDINMYSENGEKELDPALNPEVHLKHNMIILSTFI